MAQLSSAADRQNEVTVAEVIESKTGYSVYPVNDEFCPFDLYGIKDGKPSCLFEVKTRKVPSTKYAEVFMSCRKVLRMLDAGSLMNWQPVFVVQFTDGVFTFALSAPNIAKMSVSVCHRKDRGLTNDIEPCFMLPVAQMTRLL